MLSSGFSCLVQDRNRAQEIMVEFFHSALIGYAAVSIVCGVFVIIMVHYTGEIRCDGDED